MDEEDARHFNQIGWSITSFFLIFLGAIFSELIKLIKDPNYLDKTLSVSIIIFIMFFGFVVARLFLRSQFKKIKIDNLVNNKNDRFLCKRSIWIYILLLIIIETMLSLILSYIISQKDLVSILLFSIVIAITLLILVETLFLEREKIV